MPDKRPIPKQWSMWGGDHITLAKYAQIEIGMTREEVEKIISKDSADTGEPMIADEIEKLMGNPTRNLSSSTDKAQPTHASRTKERTQAAL